MPGESIPSSLVTRMRTRRPYRTLVIRPAPATSASNMRGWPTGSGLVPRMFGGGVGHVVGAGEHAWLGCGFRACATHVGVGGGWGSGESGEQGGEAVGE